MWLKQPLVDVEEINVRHNIVEAFVGDPTLRETLRDQHLRGESSSPVFRVPILGRVGLGLVGHTQEVLSR